MKISYWGPRTNSGNTLVYSPTRLPLKASFTLGYTSRSTLENQHSKNYYVENCDLARTIKTNHINIQKLHQIIIYKESISWTTPLSKTWYRRGNNINLFTNQRPQPRIWERRGTEILLQINNFNPIHSNSARQQLQPNP